MKSSHAVGVVALGLFFAESSGLARAAAPKARAKPAPEAVDREAEPETDRVRVGALGSLGFPRPLAIEGLVEINRVLSLGAEYSALPATSISGVQTSLWALAADARVYPLRGGFFIGVRAGHQRLDASTSVTVAPYGSFAGAMSIDAWFINPRIGFLWKSSAAVAIGFDAGILIPVAPSEQSNVPPYALAAARSALGTAETLGKGVLPTVDLLQVGALF
jgi:hypothetical protein